MSDILERMVDTTNQGFPDITPDQTTAEEWELMQAVGIAAMNTPNAKGLQTMFRIPPAVCLAIVRMLQPGAWEAEKKAMMERFRSAS